MADRWVRMRASLLNHPRVIRIARGLLADPDFLEWMGSDARHVTASRIVTLRHVSVTTRVTVGALVSLWCGVTESANGDGVLRNGTLLDIDQMTGVPGFGRALEAAGWAIEVADEGIRLPNFDEYNTVEKQRSSAARTDAERARDYRDRKAMRQAGAQAGPQAHQGNSAVTSTVTKTVTPKRDASRDEITLDKRRIDKRKKGAKAPLSTEDLPTWLQGLVDVYHEVVPELPRVRVMDGNRAQVLAEFRDWVLSTHRPDGSPRATNDAELIEWTRKYLELARANDFIMGRGPRSPEHRNWRCSIDYLLSSRGIRKVIEETEADCLPESSAARAEAAA